MAFRFEERQELLTYLGGFHCRKTLIYWVTNDYRGSFDESAKLRRRPPPALCRAVSCPHRSSPGTGSFTHAHIHHRAPLGPFLRPPVRLLPHGCARGNNQANCDT